MKAIVFGATGMVGQGVLRECLAEPDLDSVLVISRTKIGQKHAKLRELLHHDFFDFSTLGGQLSGYDACFFCLGVSSAGMSEEDYRAITYDITMAAARAVLTQSPEATFVYVSGQGTDSSERGRVRWARVKGQTENALLALSPHTYMLRPGYIHPVHGVTSKTRLYALIYAIAKPIYPILRRLAPGSVTTTENVGRAMIRLANAGATTRVLGNRDINATATL